MELKSWMFAVLGAVLSYYFLIYQYVGLDDGRVYAVLAAIVVFIISFIFAILLESKYKTLENGGIVLCILFGLFYLWFFNEGFRGLPGLLFIAAGIYQKFVLYKRNRTAALKGL